MIDTSRQTHAKRACIPPSLEGGGQGVGEAHDQPCAPGARHRIKLIMRERATALRNESTQPERALWYWLRKSQVQNAKFRRQAVIGDFIVDFLCPELKIVIEVDGESHVGRGFQDQLRDISLNERGYRVIRVTNDDVLTNIHGVLDVIVAAIAEIRSQQTSHAPPTP